MSFLFKARKTDRRLGNAHRDNGEWNLAAAAYRRHLEKVPSDAAIWVQLGHVEKEAGRIDAAEAAYRQAARVAPVNPDPLLHLAHMLKIVGRFDDSFQAFVNLYRLAPDQEVMNEIELVMPKRHAAEAADGAILFSMQDFFNSFGAHSTTTGIQRVQAGVALAAMADPAIPAYFIVNGDDAGDRAEFLRLDEESLRGIIDYVGGETIDHETLLHMLFAARLGGTPIRFGAGHTVVLLGSFWGLGEGVERFLDAKRAGARLAAYIHDVIPVTHPEYCDINLSNAFWRSLAELLHVVDLIMTNSDHTQQELKCFIAAQGGRTVPMRTVPLAHSLDGATVAGAVWPVSLRKVKAGCYVAYVSTVEGRKNHIYVVRAWQRMIAEGVRVPDLVFVGRAGWKIDELTELLEGTDYLDGRVHIVHGLSDAELNTVYAKAMFTVFTSLVEGWGLPVGESLVHGVPVIASRVAAIPEVGGDFVDYVDPADLDDGVRVFRRMIENAGYRAGRRRNIQAHFVPRTWRDVGRDLLLKLAAMIAAHPEIAPIAPVRLHEGVIFRPGNIMGKARPVDDYFRSPLGLAMAGSFYEAELGGAWMKGGSGELTFQTTLAGDRDLVVLLSVKPARWAVGRGLSLEMASTGAGPRRWMRLAEGRNLLRIEGPVADDGTCTLLLRYDGEPEPLEEDPRVFAVAINAIGYAAADDPAMRVELRENFLFN